MIDWPEGYCSDCGARVQQNTEGETVHARAGTYACPVVPVPELDPSVLAFLAGIANVN